jgi:Flp pilus assembly protein CpaB
VTPDQAKLLTLVDLNATLRLALRAPSEGSRRPTIGEKLDLTQPASAAQSRIAQAAAAPQAAAPAAAAPAAPAPPAHTSAPRPSGPQIIQGDKVIR